MPAARRRARPRTTWIDNISSRGQDSLWKSQSEWQRIEINGESTSMVWPTLGSRTAKEQNRTVNSWRYGNLRGWSTVRWVCYLRVEFCRHRADYFSRYTNPADTGLDCLFWYSPWGVGLKTADHRRPPQTAPFTVTDTPCVFVALDDLRMWRIVVVIGVFQNRWLV